MNELGKNTPAGFMPAVPGLEELFSNLQHKKNGWDETNNSPAGQDLKQAQDDLLRNYVQCFSSPAGQKVLEDILDMSLRRSPYLSAEGMTLEQQTAYGLERKGQNGLAIAILSKIVSGRSLPSPAAQKPGKKSP